MTWQKTTKLLHARWEAWAPISLPTLLLTLVYLSWRKKWNWVEYEPRGFWIPEERFFFWKWGSLDCGYPPLKMDRRTKKIKKGLLPKWFHPTELLGRRNKNLSVGVQINQCISWYIITMNMLGFMHGCMRGSMHGSMHGWLAGWLNSGPPPPPLPRPSLDQV